MHTKPAWLVEHDVSLDDGRTVTYSYDKEGDILEIFFERGPATCAVDITDSITLRFRLEESRAMSLILNNFTYLAQPTEWGPRSFRLKVDELPDELRQKVMYIITAPPVNHFLKVSALFLSPAQELWPIAYLEKPRTITVVK